MNQNDWSNLFNLLDSDRSGEIDLEELRLLMEQERTGKMEELKKSKKEIEEEQEHEQENEK